MLTDILRRGGEGNRMCFLRLTRRQFDRRHKISTLNKYPCDGQSTDRVSFHFLATGLAANHGSEIGSTIFLGLPGK